MKDRIENFSVRDFSKESLARLIKRRKSPFYLYDLDIFQERIEEAKRSLRDRADLCFAMKSNACLLKRAAALLDRIEVCSFGEYRICHTLGIPPEKMLISGVLKKEEDLQIMLEQAQERALYTIESPDQMKQLALWAKDNHKPLSVFIRLSSNDQFGSDADTIREMLRSALFSHLNLKGIHFYSGTMKKKAEKCIRELELLDAFLQGLEEEFHQKIPELEYGPGILSSAFLEQGEDRMEEFLLAIAQSIGEMHWKGRVTIELGRALAYPCGAYFTRICDLKKTEGTTYLMVDGGIHHLIYDRQFRGIYHPVIRLFAADGTEITKNRRGTEDGADTDNPKDRGHIRKTDSSKDTEDKVTICGSLCTVSDVLAADVPLQAAEKGDVLMFERAGAYSATSGMALFLAHELPDLLTVSETDGIEVIREGVETWAFQIPQTNSEGISP